MNKQQSGLQISTLPNIQKSVVCEMSCENSTVIEAFRDRKNFSEALPLEMIFLNFMMFKIPYAVKRELFIFVFATKTSKETCPTGKDNIVFSLTNILTKDVEV